MKNININGIKFHHVGIIVSCIEEAIKNYSIIGGTESISETFLIDSQKVKVCFVKTSKDIYLELVEPLADNLPLNKLMKKGINYYHTGYKVYSIEQTINTLESYGYKFLTPFRSEAFNMKECVFAYSPDLILFEFIEL